MKPAPVVVEAVMDDQHDVELLREAFAEVAPEVVVEFTSSGERALAKLRQRGRDDAVPDLLVTDFKLPGMDGEALVARLGADAELSRMPTVIVSGGGIGQVRRRASWIEKPIDWDGWRELARMLTTRASSRAAAQA